MVFYENKLNNMTNNFEKFEGTGGGVDMLDKPEKKERDIFHESLDEIVDSIHEDLKKGQGSMIVNRREKQTDEEERIEKAKKDKQKKEDKEMEEMAAKAIEKADKEIEVEELLRKLKEEEKKLKEEKEKVAN